MQKQQSDPSTAIIHTNRKTFWGRGQYDIEYASGLVSWFENKWQEI